MFFPEVFLGEPRWITPRNSNSRLLLVGLLSVWFPNDTRANWVYTAGQGRWFRWPSHWNGGRNTRGNPVAMSTRAVKS